MAAYDAQRRLAAESLKRCPLCGAVNALTNGECFVCRWAGSFDHDPEHVEEGLSELLIRCPELADAMMEKPTTGQRIRNWAYRFFRRFARRKLDVYA
jgi:hypothetical protein